MTNPRLLVLGLQRRTVLAAVLVSAFLLGASGCTNLQAVRDFAKISAATADYRQIVADYAMSPERLKRYQPDGFARELETEAEARAKQKQKLEAAQTILVEYMTALGDLAADDLPNVDTQVDALGKALEEAKFVGKADETIGKETGTAASTIAKILTRAVLDRWRQEQTSRIVREANDSVQIVTAGLREIVLKDFSASLDIETEAVRKCFEAATAAAASVGVQDAVDPLVRVLRVEHSDQIETRRAKLRAYANVLEKIGEGHEDLNKNVDRLQDEALKERLRAYAKDLQDLYKAIATLSE
jgi:t-SNARE complex subunit (syntaxin)